MKTPMDSDNIREWMMADLDGETTAEQHQEIQRWLAADPVLLRDYQRMKQEAELMARVTWREPGSELWDSYWQGVYRRLERGFGWVLFSVGAMVLMGYGAWEVAREWVTDSGIPLWIRAAGVSMAGGGIVLLVSVIREKLFLHKNERYKDIQR